MAFAKIHEAVHVCSLVGGQKYVQRFVLLENAESIEKSLLYLVSLMVSSSSIVSFCRPRKLR